MLLAGVSGRRRSRYSCKGSHRHQRRIGGGTGWKWERDAQDQRGNRGYNISGAEGAAMTTTLSGREPRSVEQSWRRHDQVTLPTFHTGNCGGWVRGLTHMEEEAILYFFQVFFNKYGCRPVHLQSRLRVVTPPSPCSAGKL
jgi:hypothetical protein